MVYADVELRKSKSPVGFNSRSLAATRTISPADHHGNSASAHWVQYYDDDAFPVESISDFLWEGILKGEGTVVILKARHALSVRHALVKRGGDPKELERTGRMSFLGAETTLAKLMVKGRPDPRRFRGEVAAAIDRTIPGDGGTRVIAELVALLITTDRPQAALVLEGLWNDYLRRRRVRLRCLYPLGPFTAPSLSRAFKRITDIHGDVVPVLDRSRPDPEQTGRWIARLQQQARALAAQIEQRKRAESELAASREQLRALSRYLLTVREEERKRISRRVHDELGQSLSALKLDLAWLLRRLGKGQPRLSTRIDAMSASVDEIIHTVWRVASELRPLMLDDLGLVATLEWQAREFQSRSEIICELDLPEELPNLDPDHATALFRIFQETLTNVYRHAGASVVHVRLGEGPRGLDLTIQDDGVGIALEKLNSSASLGLIGMRERAQAIGAAISISGEPGQGTTVHIQLPRGRIRRKARRIT
jgi:signal transduction histidine kinase